MPLVEMLVHLCRRGMGAILLGDSFCPQGLASRMDVLWVEQFRDISVSVGDTGV